jgi:hypothetical protein
MNWTGVLVLIVLVLSSVTWWMPGIGAKYHFVGPKRHDHQEISK